MFGWRGRLLRVNLTSGAIENEVLEPEVVRNYLGGRGLGLYLHAKEVSVSTAPRSPENHLVFSTGPLTGTLAPNGGRHTVVTRTQPGGALQASSIAGLWGPGLKYAGFDAIVVEGRSEKPVYLWVNNRKAELRSAEPLAGKPASETADQLLKETDPGAAVSCIGPAGENGISCSVILSDRFSAAGRGGAGAVMGSKNLKAVVVYGTEGLRMADHQGFAKAALELRTFMKDRALALKGARIHDPVLEVESVEWQCAPQSSKPARTRACFGCATSFSSFMSADGRSLPMSAGDSPAELGERLNDYRSFLDLGLDYAAAKEILASLGQDTEAAGVESARRLAFGDLRQNGGERLLSASSIDRGPCIAAGYAIFPRIPTADGQDEEASDLMALLDSAGLCPFLVGAIGVERIAELLTSATGCDYSQAEVMNVAQRVSRSIRWTA